MLYSRLKLRTDASSKRYEKTNIFSVINKRNNKDYMYANKIPTAQNFAVNV